LQKKFSLVLIRLAWTKKKAEEVELTYPLLYFAIDDFNETWKDITLSQDGEVVCVELFAEGSYFSNGTPIRIRLFGGGLDYAIIKSEYKNKKGILTSNSATHFFNLIGPNGKGSCQMAVNAITDPSASPNANNSPTQEPHNPNNASKWNSSVQWSLNSFNKIGSALKKMNFMASPENPILVCSLTTLSMKWDLLMKDMLGAAIRHVSSKQ